MSGKIDISQLKHPPHKHELDTAKFFAERGYDIVFIPPSNIPGVHKPDIIMAGKEWEIKSPTGKGRNMISRILKVAAKQSKNVIVDLRNIKTDEKTCLSQIEKRVDEHTTIKRVLVIKKNEELLEYSTKGIKLLIDTKVSRK